jgi:hypothetical protein
MTNQYAGLEFFNDCRECGHHKNNNGKFCTQKCGIDAYSAWIPKPVPLTPANTPNIRFEKVPQPESEVMPLAFNNDTLWEEPNDIGFDQHQADAKWILDYLKSFESNNPSIDRISGHVLSMDSEHWQSLKWHLKRKAKGK